MTHYLKNGEHNDWGDVPNNSDWVIQMQKSDVDGLEFSLQRDSRVVVLDEFVELFLVGVVQFRKTEQPLVNID